MMKVPSFDKIKDTVKSIPSSLPKVTDSRETGSKAERSEKKRLIITSVLAILAFVLCIFAILHFFSPGGVGNMYQYLEGMTGSILSLLFAVIILDTITAYSDKKKARRDERKAIIRHNKIIQPVVDMYIVRKNMVITPKDKTVRKFQINSKFSIKDMKDMFGPSELVSDVGKSKIEMYAFYQDKLQDKLTHLVEEIDFKFYPDLCDAAMKYINATSYGSSAMYAVVGYQDSMAGTKSMRSIVLNMMRDEPDDGRFVDAPPALKNVYLLHQTINDQESALGEYLRIIQEMLREDSRENAPSKMDYE